MSYAYFRTLVKIQFLIQSLVTNSRPVATACFPVLRAHALTNHGLCDLLLSELPLVLLVSMNIKASNFVPVSLSYIISHISFSISSKMMREFLQDF